MKSAILWCVLAPTILAAEPSTTKVPNSWVGKKVLTQFGTVLKVGNVVVDDEGRTASLAATGQDRNLTRVYRVEHAQGRWLWLRDEQSGIAGWAPVRSVIPFDQAISYYSSLIPTTPSGWAHGCRGFAWYLRGEYDQAIADLDEAIGRDPVEPIYWNNRGLAWEGKKDHDQAIADYTEAIRLDRRYTSPLICRGLAWCGKGNFDRAISDLSAAIRINPEDSLAYHNRAYAWTRKGDQDRAIADFSTAIRINPQNAAAFRDRGDAWWQKENLDRALADYDEAIRLDPRDAASFRGRAGVWRSKHDHAKAISDLSEAIRLDPRNAFTYSRRAAAWSGANDYDKAEADFDQALELDPRLVQGHNGRAWLWATCPEARFRDGKKAVEAATRALDLSGGKDADVLDTLAASYAELGDFPRAIEWEEKALKLDPGPNAKDYQQRLDLYRTNQPYRNHH